MKSNINIPEDSKIIKKRETISFNVPSDIVAKFKKFVKENKIKNKSTGFSVLVNNIPQNG